ncbi:transposase [Roseateles sp.]|uniref:IS66-like element accessory protein TnpA n=1 Tax=Roseateles sp. TaxID=1971397 RepID=UPI0025E6B2B0|nr:transposase [Roseateles sp.]
MKSEEAAGKRSRRQHDRTFKEDLVRQSLEPGASVSAIALRHGINANMLFKWRRELVQTDHVPAASTVLLPVAVVPPSEVVTVPAPIEPTTPAPCGVIEMEIADVLLRLRGAVDEASLCSVLRALRQTR